MNILVTGAAGFIGFHLSKSLLGKGHTIVGLDNINDYYTQWLSLNGLLSINLNKLDNDIELLQYAGHGVAMKNAHDSLLEVADDVTLFSNKENGVMKYLQKYLANKKG